MEICSISVELIGSFGEAYPGSVVDFKAPNSLTFRFVCGDSPGFPQEINVQPNRLRRPPRSPANDVKEAHIAVGDDVEVLAGKPVSDLPPSWWPARVIKKRGDFVVVDFNKCEKTSDLLPNVSKPHLDTVVEMNQIRQKSSERLLSESDFLYHILDVPKELVDLFKETAHIQNFVRACGQSMLICQVISDMQLPNEFASVSISEESTAKFLIVCTSLEAILKAQTLEFDVIRMLKQKYSILHQINELLRRRKKATSINNDELICEEFFVEKGLVGHSIGAGGANIHRARSVDGIVSVILNPNTCTFKVAGKTKEAVENAKNLLEYATEVIQVPQQYVARIVGQKNHQIQALVDQVGLARIRVQAADEATVPNCVPFAFTGTRSAINSAKILINFVIDNLKEIDELQSTIASHEYNRFPNGDRNRYKKRDFSINSESLKGEPNARSNRTDRRQAADSGTTVAANFNDNGGRATDTGDDNLDLALNRNFRQLANQHRKNQLQQLRGDEINSKPPSLHRPTPLSPYSSKTNETAQHSDNTPLSGPRRGGGGRRGKGGNQNRAPQMAITTPANSDNCLAVVES